MRVTWDTRPYEIGIDRFIYFPTQDRGIPWYGVRSVTVVPDGGEIESLYLDGQKIGRFTSSTNYNASIEAYTYPELLFNILYERSAGSAGFCYRSKTEDSYKLHIVYNTYLAPEHVTYEINEATPFRYDATSIPITVENHAPTSHISVEPSRLTPEIEQAINDILYGTEASDPRLPSLEELLEITTVIRVIDEGDGIFTVVGPDSAVRMVDPTTFELAWPSVQIINDDEYTVHSF